VFGDFGGFSPSNAVPSTRKFFCSEFRTASPEQRFFVRRPNSPATAMPKVATANDLIRFTVRFNDPRFNTAAARREFEGRWNFGHDEYGEVGWDPFHYFPRAGSFPVKFSFQGAGPRPHPARPSLPLRNDGYISRGRITVVSYERAWKSGSRMSLKKFS